MAVVGTSEKGYESWEIAVRGTGGHSSLPPVDGSTGERQGITGAGWDCRWMGWRDGKLG